MAVLLLVAGGAAVTLLSPGGLGDPGARIVRDGPSAQLYRNVVEGAAGAPDWLRAGNHHVALGGVLLLLALLVGTGWAAWRQRTPAFAGSLVVLVGTTVAYLMSEVLKLVIGQERPCRVFPAVTTWEACPAVGDWSFPSNHATVVGGLAVGLALLVPRLALLTLPVAGTVAVVRVVGGVHYPHDVLAGLLFGATVTAACVILLARSPSR